MYKKRSKKKDFAFFWVNNDASDKYLIPWEGNKNIRQAKI